MKRGGKNIFIDIFKGVAKSAAVLWLFYQNIVIVALGSIPYGIFNRKNEAGRREKKQKEKICAEFRGVMLDIASSLSAGYSVENAWREAAKNLRVLYGGNSLLYGGLEKVCVQIECSIPLEQALMEYAQKSGVEEIIRFAEVFSTAKRTGGNLIEVTKNTARGIGERIEVKREINAMLAGKQMEGRVMNMIPLAMILYFHVCSPGFLDCLYTGSGHIIMTVFLLIYLVSLKWSERIGDIEV